MTTRMPFQSATTGPAVLVAIALAGPALAADLVLPAESYDAFTRITLANTAGQTCPGARLNEGNLNRATVAAMQALMAAGIDPNAAAAHLGTPEGLAALAAREAALRSRHGVAAEGADALCAAIKAETASDRELAKIISLR